MSEPQKAEWIIVGRGLSIPESLPVETFAVTSRDADGNPNRGTVTVLAPNEAVVEEFESKLGDEIYLKSFQGGHVYHADFRRVSIAVQHAPGTLLAHGSRTDMQGWETDTILRVTYEWTLANNRRSDA